MLSDVPESEGVLVAGRFSLPKDLGKGTLAVCLVWSFANGTLLVDVPGDVGGGCCGLGVFAGCGKQYGLR